MTLRRTLVGERINKPSTVQIKKKIKQSQTVDNFQMKPGYIYTVVRAISARINQNFDGWPADELKKSYRSFIGKPVFVNHENYDPKEARGVVVASRFVENGNDKYIEVVQEIDAQRFPKLAHEIRTGGLDSVSMGAEAAFTICSYCTHKATDETDMCDHVKYHKGEKLAKFNQRTGKTEDILVYESCHKLSFFELSYVFEPADETAVASKVLVASKKTAAVDPRQREAGRFKDWWIGDDPENAPIGDLDAWDRGAPRRRFDPDKHPEESDPRLVGASFEEQVLKSAGMTEAALHALPDRPGRHSRPPGADPRRPPEGFPVYDAAEWLSLHPEYDDEGPVSRQANKTAGSNNSYCPPGMTCNKGDEESEDLGETSAPDIADAATGGVMGGATGTPASTATGGEPGKPGADGLLDNNRALYNDLMKQFPGSDIGKYRVDSYHEHDHGALDFMTTDPDQAAAVRAKAFSEGAPYVLWQQTQWNADGSSSKMNDRGDPTQNHFDHVHIAPIPISNTPPADIIKGGNFERQVLRMAGYKTAISAPVMGVGEYMDQRARELGRPLTDEEWDHHYNHYHNNWSMDPQNQVMGEFGDPEQSPVLTHPHLYANFEARVLHTAGMLRQADDSLHGPNETFTGPNADLNAAIPAPLTESNEFFTGPNADLNAAIPAPLTETFTGPNADLNAGIPWEDTGTSHLSPGGPASPGPGNFTAQVLKTAFGETEAPASVDTLREEGSAEEDDNNDFHHYVQSPEGLAAPNLGQAGQLDREGDQQQQGVGQAGANPEDDMEDPTPYMVLKIPMPGQQPPPMQLGQPPQPPQIPQQQFAANVRVPRSLVASIDRYFGINAETTTLGNGRGVSETSRNPRKGSTMGRSRTNLAQRGKVASRGQRQHFAEGPYTDGGPYGTTNDQGEQEEVFLSDTPPPEPVAAPTDDTENISNTKENLVARVQRGRAQLLKDAQALAAYQQKQGSVRQGEATAPINEVNPTVQDSASEELTGDHFESLGEAPVDTSPKQAAVSLQAFQAFDRWLHQATGRQARSHTARNIRIAADEWAKRANADVRVLFPALGIVLRQARKLEAAQNKGAKMRKRADEKLEVAAPDDRIDVEKPTSNVTDEEAQESQFDLSDFADNASDSLADPDLSTDSQFWAPGEGSKTSRKAPRKAPRAGGILAVRAAEAYINAGLEPNTRERKYQLAGAFENADRGVVQRDIALLERVAALQSQQRQKVAAGSTRGAARSIPQGLTSGGTRRAASVQRLSANDPSNDSLLFD